MSRPADVLELIRAPALFTVAGDTLAGDALAGCAGGRRTPALIASSSLLYAAGMALNDYADADLDRAERPERPIPSGRISRREALVWACGLTAAGISAAAVAGRRHLVLALPLAGLVWTYDLVAKESGFGPVVMAACRAVDVLLGAGASAGDSRVLCGAAVVGAHTWSITTLSRDEVSGTRPAVAAVSTTLSCLVSAAAVLMARPDPRARAGAAAAAAGYLSVVAPAQVRAGRVRRPGAVRRATRSGIAAFLPLQAAMVAGAGRLGTAGVLGALVLVLRAAARRRATGDVT